MDNSGLYTIYCENPRLITTKQGLQLRVSCGVCKSCLLHKSSYNGLRCLLESSSYKYVIFASLTYDERYLPRFVFRRHPLGYSLISKCRRDVDNYLKEISFISDEYLNETHLTIQDIRDKHNSSYGYVCLRDYQLFLKRLRKNFTNLYKKHYGTEFTGVRYYGCSEYGPEHFRPHYHFLFFSDDIRFVAQFEKALSMSWQFGLRDWSISRGHSEQYVSGYVNSMYYIPRYFASRPCRPFSSHSNNFTSSFYEGLSLGLFRQISSSWLDFCDRYRSYLLHICKFSYTSNGNEYRATLSRYTALSRFVKCVGFSELDFRDRIDKYKVYHHVKSFFGKVDSTVKSLATTLYGLCGQYDYKFSTNYHYNVIYRLTCDLSLDQFVQLVYYSSKIYSYLFSEGLDPDNYGSYILYDKTLCRYHDFFDYGTLCKSLSEQALHSLEVPLNPLDIQYIYGNIMPDDIEHSDFIDNLKNKSLISFRDAVKHRELNSLNTQFI